MLLILLVMVPLPFTDSGTLRAVLESFAFLGWIAFFITNMKLRKEVKSLEALRNSEVI